MSQNYTESKLRVKKKVGKTKKDKFVFDVFDDQKDQTDIFN